MPGHDDALLQQLIVVLYALCATFSSVHALLTKPDRREIDVPVRYVGFEIPNRFVIGYGLDFGERYRNLPYVAVLSDDALPDGI